MTAASDYIKTLQKPGVMLVMDGKLFFIPDTVLLDHKMPDEFQRGFKGVSEDYFEKRGKPKPDANPTSIVFTGISQTLAEAFVTDGVSQAVRVSRADNQGGKLTSKAAQSEQPLFRYSDDENKIVVDMARGGRPSDS